MMANVRTVELIIEQVFLDKFHRLMEQRTTLLAALEAVEWTGAVDGGTVCPWCGERKYNGHAPDCPRQAAIARARDGA